MGNHKPFHEPGDKSSGGSNGRFYSPPNWRYYVLDKRPKNVRAKRAIVLFSVDVIALFIIIGIIKNLSDAKELIALIVAIWWLGGRAVIITVKIISFWGKNSESIKKGFKSLRDLFKE